MDFEHYQVGFLFAGFCVAVYAHQRFNSPAPLRCTTTLVQYYVALGGYVVSALAFYALLSWVMRVNPDVKELLISMSGGDVTGTGDIANFSASFIAALFMTILLPKVPVLKTFDSGIRGFFRKLGAIPHAALRLSWRLQRKPFHVPPGNHEELRTRLEKQELKPAAFLAAKEGTPEAIWAQVVSLKASLEDYVAVNPLLAQLLDSELAAIAETYERQSEMATIVFGRTRTPARLRRAFYADCKTQLRDLSEAISRGVLRTQGSLRSVHGVLWGFGYRDLESDRERISANQIAGLVMGLALYLSIIFFVLNGGAGTVSFYIKLPILISVIIGASIACALVPKTLLPELTRRDRNGQRPYLFYLVAGLAAAALWFAIQIVRFALEGVALDQIPVEIRRVQPFILISVAVAFATAWMADNRPERSRLPEGAYHWFEGLVLALVLAAVGYLAQLWLFDIGFLRNEPPNLRMLATTGGMGFIVGFFAPTLYRTIPKEQAALRREEEAIRGYHARKAAAPG